ncbi:hypothetical protein PkoCFBP13504_14505 [Pseudomonas koreensis]|nr:hypothetical protein PkoCFBP13504_14505 [Pseudomonas koreensis]
MVLAPRCLHKRSTALPPFPLASLFATLQTLIGTDQLVRRVPASLYGLPDPVPASHRRAPAIVERAASAGRASFYGQPEQALPGSQCP